MDEYGFDRLADFQICHGCADQLALHANAFRQIDCHENIGQVAFEPDVEGMVGFRPAIDRAVAACFGPCAVQRIAGVADRPWIVPFLAAIRACLDQ